jgi:oligopeptide transport system ATP-binding protein
VVAGLCDEVMVMYGGRVGALQRGNLFAGRRIRTRSAFLRALPRLDQNGAALQGIPGNPPNMANPPAGCAFQERCIDIAPRTAANARLRSNRGQRSDAAARVPSARSSGNSARGTTV